MGSSGSEGEGGVPKSCACRIVAADLCFQGCREIAESGFILPGFEDGRENDGCLDGCRASKTSATKSWEYDSGGDGEGERSEGWDEYLEEVLVMPESRFTRSRWDGWRGSKENAP